MASSNPSSASANVSQSIGSSEPSLSNKRKSKDIGWEYGILEDPSKSTDKMKCLLCDKNFSGGVYRMKEHIAGKLVNITRCFKATPEDKKRCMDALNEGKMRKYNKKGDDRNLRAEVNIDREICSIDVDELHESFGSAKPPRSVLGPMDKFATEINPESSLGTTKSIKQQRILDAFAKEKLIRVKEYIYRWAYEADIPFYALERDSFKMMLEAVGQYGARAKPPTRYEISETYLKKEVDKVRESLKTHEDHWKANGCSIMTDAWTDRKRRSVMNLCINSSLGTVFLSSKECSLDAHTSEYIFEYVEHGIMQVGVENVVQIVTDNAANNMGAAKMLKEKRPNIFWTSCATHSINLMLESIANLPRYKKVLDQAKTLTIFIYAHHKTLALMRSYTKKRDIVRPGVTTFASAFLTLQSLIEKKVQLKAMFTSNEWDDCKFSKTPKGKIAYTTAMSNGFWLGVSACLKVFSPLVRVLRIVDGDKKPSMGFVYGELLQAKEDIKSAMNDAPRNYEPIMTIIDAKMKDRLDTPLQKMACLLNPYYHFKDKNLCADEDIVNGSIEFLETYFFNDVDMQNHIIGVELTKYKKKEGMFGKPVAEKNCMINDEKFDPANWWLNFGTETPILRGIAVRILSLTSSSSGCERNWSTFEGIHTKKRNRLESTRLNNLVFVQFNASLMNKRKKEQNVEILLASDAKLAQDWMVENSELDPGLDWEDAIEGLEADEPLRPRRSSRLRELDEDTDAETESDEEINVNKVEFEDDEHCMIEQYGQGEEGEDQLD